MYVPLSVFSVDELRENGELQEEGEEPTGSPTEPQPTDRCQLHNERDYSRIDSYQAFFVYPVKERDANMSWHSSLSVCLHHPVFSRVSAYYTMAKLTHTYTVLNTHDFHAEY